MEKDKNFGMGKDHPVAWYRRLEKGRTFYTSIGHDASLETRSICKDVGECCKRGLGCNADISPQPGYFSEIGEESKAVL